MSIWLSNLFEVTCQLLYLIEYVFAEQANEWSGDRPPLFANVMEANRTFRIKR